MAAYNPRHKTYFHLRATGMVLLAWGASSAYADPYPSKPVTIVVAQAPGGGNDAVARVLAARLSTVYGQQFIVENRPGAGGNIGSAFVARAPKDGYTIFMTSSSHTINPSLYKRVPYEPVKDFAPIAMVANVSFVLVANPHFAARTMGQLIALAEQQPGKINYASAGNGTLNHLLAEMLKSATRVEMTHVPYKGSAAALTDVIAGLVPVGFNSLTAALPFIKGGQLRALGVSSQQRSALAPDIPPVADAVHGFDAMAWYGLVAPTGTPKAIVESLARETSKALSNPEVVRSLGKQGAEPAYLGPDAMAAFLEKDLQRWASVVKTSGAQVD